MLGKLFTASLLFGTLASGAINQDALRMCQESGGFKTICLSIIKDAQYERVNLQVCDDLRNRTAKLVCMHLVKNENFDHDLLRECDGYRNDWEVTDCIKTISNKPADDLDFQISAPVERRTWVQNYDTAKQAWNALDASINAFGSFCSGYRYIQPIDPDWRLNRCWATTFSFQSGPGVPDETLGQRYRVGSTTNNHCVVPLQCVSK